MAAAARRPLLLPAAAALLAIAAAGCVLSGASWWAAFAAGGGQRARTRTSVRGSRVALGPKFLKDLGLEKPDWLPEFGGGDKGGQGGEAEGQEDASGAADTAGGAADTAGAAGTAGVAGVGDAMPEITLPNQDGQPVSISSFKKGQFPWEAGKPVVLFFFAGSASPSCTKECQAFRDNYEKFQEKGAKVIGVSLDSPEFNTQFKVDEALPFDLLSDEGGSTAQALQIPKDAFGFLNGRQTYVVSEDGKIKKVFNSQFEPEKHVDESLSAL